MHPLGGISSLLCQVFPSVMVLVLHDFSSSLPSSGLWPGDVQGLPCGSLAKARSACRESQRGLAFLKLSTPDRVRPCHFSKTKHSFFGTPGLALFSSFLCVLRCLGVLSGVLGDLGAWSTSLFSRRDAKGAKVGMATGQSDNWPFGGNKKSVDSKEQPNARTVEPPNSFFDLPNSRTTELFCPRTLALSNCPFVNTSR